MGVLDFIFGIIALVFVFIAFVGFIGIKYDNAKLNKEIELLTLENAKLKRKNRSKKEEK